MSVIYVTGHSERMLILVREVHTNERIIVLSIHPQNSIGLEFDQLSSL